MRNIGAIEASSLQALLIELCRIGEINELPPLLSFAKESKLNLSLGVWNKMLFSAAKSSNPSHFLAVYDAYSLDHQPNIMTYTILMFWNVQQHRYDQLEPIWAKIDRPDSKAAKTYLIGLLQGGQVAKAKEAFFGMSEEQRQDAANCNFLIKRLAEADAEGEWASIQNVLLAMQRQNIVYNKGTWVAVGKAITNLDRLEWLLKLAGNSSDVAANLLRHSPLFDQNESRARAAFQRIVAVCRLDYDAFHAILDWMVQKGEGWVGEILGGLAGSLKSPEQIEDFVKAVAANTSTPGHVRSARSTEDGLASIIDHICGILCGQRRFGDAAVLYMQHRNLLPKANPSVIGTIAMGLSDEGSVDQALQIVLEWLRNSSRYFPVAAFKDLFRKLEERNRRTDISNLLKTLEAISEPYQWKFTAILYGTALVHGPATALEQYRAYRQLGFTPDQLDIANLAYLLIRKGMHHEARKVLKEAVLDGARITDAIRAMQLQVAALLGDPREFFRHLPESQREELQRLFQAFKSSITFPTVKAIVSAELAVSFATLLWKNLGDLQALHFIESLAGHVEFTPNRQFLRLWTRIWVDVLEEDSCTKKPSIEAILWQMECCGKAELGTLENLLKIATVMDDSAMFQRIYRMIAGLNFSPSITIYQSLMVWCERSGSLEACESVLKAMQQTSISPNTAIIERVIGCALKAAADGFPLALEWINKAIAGGHQLALPVMSAFFQAAYERLSFEECLRLLEAFRRTGTPAISDALTERFLQGALEAGNTKWAHIFYKSLSESFISSETLDRVIDMYLFMGDFERAYGAYNRTKSRSSSSFYSLLLDRTGPDRRVQLAIRNPILPLPFQPIRAGLDVITYASTQGVGIGLAWCHRVMENSLAQGDLHLSRSLHVYMTSHGMSNPTGNNNNSHLPFLIHNRSCRTSCPPMDC